MVTSTRSRYVSRRDRIRSLKARLARQRELLELVDMGLEVLQSAGERALEVYLELRRALGSATEKIEARYGQVSEALDDWCAAARRIESVPLDDPTFSSLNRSLLDAYKRTARRYGALENAKGAAGTLARYVVDSARVSIAIDGQILVVQLLREIIAAGIDDLGELIDEEEFVLALVRRSLRSELGLAVFQPPDHEAERERRELRRTVRTERKKRWHVAEGRQSRSREDGPTYAQIHAKAQQRRFRRAVRTHDHHDVIAGRMLDTGRMTA